MRKLLIRSSLLGILDTLFFSLSLYLSAIITMNTAVMKHFVNFLAIALIIKLMVYYLFGTYHTLWRYASVEELFKITIAAILGNGISFFIMDMIDPDVKSYFTMINCILDLAFTGGIRISYRLGRRLKNYRSLPKYRKVLIVGAGEAGVALLKEYKRNLSVEAKVVGFVDDDIIKQEKYINGVKVLGKVDDIPNIVLDKKIEEIVICMPSVPSERIKDILSICKGTPAKTKILPRLTTLIDGEDFAKQVREVEIEDLLGREPVLLNNSEISGYIEGKVVLVTGGGGSIGSELCRQIAKFNPKQLIIIDIYENNVYDLQMELKRKEPNLNLKVLIASVREKDRIDEIFNLYRPDVVFHAAAHKHVPLMEDSPGEAIKNNVFGTLNVAQISDKYKVKQFVLISTDKAVNPTNIMGASKRLCEMIIQSINNVSETKFVAVRFGNVLGSNGSVIPLFKKQIADGGPVTVTHPEITRYFMTIPEASQLVIQAGAMANGGEIFILDMGESVKIVDLAKTLIRLSGYEPDKDIKIEFTGLRPGEKLYEELLLNEEGLRRTNHKKILVGKPGNIEYKILLRNIALLKQAVDENKDVKTLMTKIVPTYNPAPNSNDNMKVTEIAKV